MPPADWYDDPEDRFQYRYWNGDEWTDHRSPRAIPPPPGALSEDSAWTIFGKIFSVLGATWREAVVVALPLAVGTLVGASLIYFGVNDALNVDTKELLERVTTPGFDPASGDDKIFFDSVEVTATGTAVLAAAIGGIVWTLAAAVSTLGLSRLFVAHRNGVDLEANAALRGGLRRIPRLFLFILQLFLVLLIATIVLTVLGVIIPVLLILTIPATVVALVWLSPYLMVAAVAVAAGPRDSGVIATTRSAMVGRWRHVVLRLLLLILLGLGLSLPIGAISNAIFAISLWGYGLITALVQAFQMVVSGAGYALIYDGIAAPVDPELTPSGAQPDLD